LGQRHPEIQIPGCRLFSVGDYVIFYQQVSDGIVIARVIHGSQNWQR
jgi:plasmid stabilization system protein ParE